MQDQTKITLVVNLFLSHSFSLCSTFRAYFFFSLSLSQQGCKKYAALSLCIINETVFPKQPEIQVVPKHSRVEQRGQKAYVTGRESCLSTDWMGKKNWLPWLIIRLQYAAHQCSSKMSWNRNTYFICDRNDISQKSALLLMYVKPQHPPDGSASSLFSSGGLIDPTAPAFYWLWIKLCREWD